MKSKYIDQHRLSEADSARSNVIDAEMLENTAIILSAMADTARLSLLLTLHQYGEQCVSSLATMLNDKANTISMRLKKLYDAGLVSKHREGKHIFYCLKDNHIVTILQNAIEHANHHQFSNHTETLS